MTHSSEMRVPPQKLLPSMVTATCLYLFWSNVIISSPNLNNEMQMIPRELVGNGLHSANDAAGIDFGLTTEACKQSNHHVIYRIGYNYECN
jgi:hypothetical protein